MALSPTQLDLWFARELAWFLKLHPLFYLGVLSAIRHNVLGGFWFGGALFIFWTQAQKKDRADMQVRILTILAGSLVAVLFMLIASALVTWPPPFRYSGLADLFPNYIYRNEDTNSFPSQSTTLYSSVAAGVYSLHKAFGWVLWVLVAVFVALPRMFVGGHYLTDVLAGALLGLAGYAVTRRFLETRLVSKMDEFLNKGPRLGFLREFFVFIWILEVTVEFKDVVWIRNAVKAILG
jgi:membrane-associated phospholipid phosphatase